MDFSTHSSWDEWLASRSTEELTTLLQLRPDVSVPPPTSLVVLSTRLTQQRSYRRALTSLHRPLLHLLYHIAATTSRLTEADPEHVTTLQNYALLYRENNDGTYLLPPGLAEVLHQIPLDLHTNPPLRDATNLRARLGTIPSQQRRVLDTLAESGRRGRSSAVQEGPADHPLRQLLDAGLLRLDQADESGTTVLLPEDVYNALHQSEAAAHDTPLEMPHPTGAESRLSSLLGQQTAPPSGLERFVLLRHTLTTLIDAIDAQPLQALADGGVGQRELRRLTKDTGLATADAIIGLEALAAVGIIEEDLTSDKGWTATIQADAFLHASPTEQWELVLHAWWNSPRAWSGTPQERAHALKPDAEDQHNLGLRHQLLTTMALWPQEISSAQRSDIAALAHWNYPLIPALTGGTTFHDTLAVAEALGLVQYHVLTKVGRAAIAGDVSTALSEVLPSETTSFVVQDDYTILVQGFLSPTHTDLLRRIATVESPGIATVYRIDDSSIRHGLDTGLTATDIQRFLQDLSQNGVPQSLQYLIDDAARRHGALRVAPALAVVHSDDPTLISGLVASSALQNCGVRALAPTVAIADVTPRELHRALQQAGYSPILEDHHGSVIALQKRRSRLTPDNPYHSPIPSESPLTPRTLHSQLSTEQVAEIVGRLQAAEENKRHSGPALTGDSIIPVLQDAIAKHYEVIVGIIRDPGVDAQIRVLPTGMSGGRLDATDLATRQPYRFALHKIRSVRTVTG